MGDSYSRDAEQKGVGVSHLPITEPECQLPLSTRLRNSAEFRSVYVRGKRYNTPLMTAFILGNGLDRHRLGITASRKMAKTAVERNRAKRLLNEAFRLSSTELDSLQMRYDWVLNARRALLTVKVSPVINELQAIIAQLIKAEQVSSAGFASKNEKVVNNITKIL